ncbi:MAG TPA: hypothetical protein PLD20_34305 [Blastocatellia bacterium]|nr:hypothetical protein [Blastocatellia bacterium]HMX29610.1 hypothetical protein [Blastocatellia bacterium]HMZ23048.1 hypothetical protein [Blastocatellia bacterium]HNG32231.1 hypothetical protein [Blastocatellia bacterium]
MKKSFSLSLLVAVMLMFGIAAQAQTESTESAAGNANITIAQGASAKLSLQTQLSSKISEVGDEVLAVLYEPVRSADGRVAIPRGTEFIGRVTQVQAAKRPQKQATMTIVFEKMRMSYGTEKIATVVTAIDDFANDEKMRSKDDEGKVGGGHSGGRTAKNAGIGGGIGTLGGILVGGIGGMAGAIGVGAAGGVLMTKGNDIKLAAGTILRIRFERDIALPAFEAGRQ